MKLIPNINLKKIYLYARDFLSNYIFIKQTLYLFIASIILGILVSCNETPKFYISSTLLENQDESSIQFDSGSAIAQLVQAGGGGENNSSFKTFRTELYSFSTAKVMWDQGWGMKAFGERIYDKKNEKYKFKPVKISDRLASWLLGYSPKEEYSHRDLANYIRNSISLSKELYGVQITGSLLHPDPNFGENFLKEAVLTADSNAKKKLLSKTELRLIALYEEYENNSNRAVSSSIVRAINQELVRKASLKNDLPYFIYFVDEPTASTKPYSPNLGAIFFSLIFISLVLSIGITYFKRHKNELW